MALRVSSTGFTDTFTRDAQRLQRSLYEAQSEIQSGQRMRVASDDPQAMGVVLSSQSDKRMISAWETNRVVAYNITDSSHRKLTEYYNNVYVAAQETALNTTAKSPDDLKLLSVPVNGFIERGLDLIQSKFGLGEYLFGGDNISTPPFSVTRDALGQVTNVQYVGATTSRSFTISDGQQVSPQLSTQSAAELATCMNNLIGLRDALNTGVEANIEGARQLMQGDEAKLLIAISHLGATETRIEGFEAENKMQYHEADQTISRQTDSDFTEAVTRFWRLQTALDASYRSSSMVMKSNIFQYA